MELYYYFFPDHHFIKALPSINSAPVLDRGTHFLGGITALVTALAMTFEKSDAL